MTSRRRLAISPSGAMCTCAVVVARRDDGLADHRHRLCLPACGRRFGFASSVCPAPAVRVRSSAGGRRRSPSRAADPARSACRAARRSAPWPARPPDRRHGRRRPRRSAPDIARTHRSATAWPRRCRRACHPRRPRCGSCRRAPAPPARRSPPACTRKGLRSRRHSSASSMPAGRLCSARAAYSMRRAASFSCTARRHCGLTCTTSTLRMCSSDTMPISTALTPGCRHR